MCAVARRIECDVGCEQQSDAWKDTVTELRDKCVAAGDSGDGEKDKEDKRELKQQKKRCMEVYKTNLQALKLARKNCNGCCELGGHDSSCQAPPVLCGDDVVGEGEACDGQDDAACPGQCEVRCGCAFSPASAFMIVTPGAL